MAEETRMEILKTHGKDVEYCKRIHSSNLYTGKTKITVDANINMSTSNKLVRHIATVLLCQNTKFVEVQVAVNHKDKKIYISSNKNITFLKILINNKNLSQLEIPEINIKDKRELRHAKKLIEEQKIYGEYKLIHISTKYSDGQHAETKIISVIGNNFDYIGGTRRPCTACFLYMQIMNIPKEKYNPHHGAFWDSKCALMSLIGKENKIDKTYFDNKFYCNKNLPSNKVHDYDTDSEE